MIIPAHTLRGPRLTFERLTPPAVEPVSIELAKAHCRIDIPDDDLLVTGWITMAREHCEKICRRQFITATYALLMDGFPHQWHWGAAKLTERAEGTDILLPRPKLQSVQSITYKDTSGNQQTVDDGDYIVSAMDMPGRIALAHGKTWPDALHELNAVRINYTAGYGDAAEDVPSAIIQAMLLLCSHWNENREAALTGARAASVEVDFSVSALLRPHVCAELWEGGGQ